jgi:rfaE bifunctional protein kinase chain/domain
MSAWADLIARFERTRVLVYGDFVADVFIQGRPARLSREAPVPILHYEGERVLPGSAGNVVRNLRALGAEAACVGAVGCDEMGERLRRSVAEAGADASGLLDDVRVRTGTKTRIMAGGLHRAKQQIVRIDRDADGRPPADLVRRLFDEAVDRLPRCEGVIISDYGGGVVFDEAAAAAGAWAGERVVVADSRYRPEAFAGITAATPNEAEFVECLSRLGMKDGGFGERAEALRRRLGLAALLVTRGNRGMALFEADRAPVDIPIVGRDDVIDVTGAGDTVVATFTLALVCGATPEQAAHLANHAANVAVTKAGTATCSRDELRRSLARSAGDPDNRSED